MGLLSTVDVSPYPRVTIKVQNRRSTTNSDIPNTPYNPYNPYNLSSTYNPNTPTHIADTKYAGTCALIKKCVALKNVRYNFPVFVDCVLCVVCCVLCVACCELCVLCSILCVLCCVSLPFPLCALCVLFSAFGVVRHTHIHTQTYIHTHTIYTALESEKQRRAPHRGQVGQEVRVVGFNRGGRGSTGSWGNKLSKGCRGSRSSRIIRGSLSSYTARNLTHRHTRTHTHMHTHKSQPQICPEQLS